MEKKKKRPANHSKSRRTNRVMAKQRPSNQEPWLRALRAAGSASGSRRFQGPAALLCPGDQLAPHRGPSAAPRTPEKAVHPPAKNSSLWKDTQEKTRQAKAGTI